MTQQTDVSSGAPRLIDTRGDVPFGSTYAAVVLIELIVLAALWSFSRYFGA